MNKSTLKRVLLLLIIMNFSCGNNDDYGNCNDSNIPVSFTIKVKLVSDAGENLFNDDDFDSSLLKLTDPSNFIIHRAFSQIIVDGDQLIEFKAHNMNSVNFVYDDENKFYFGFHDIITQTENCTISVVSYKALKLNGDLVCDCSTDDILVITLDL